MGRISIDLFTTLDGVAQAPGAPEEDASDGFPFGGWQAPLVDPMVGESVIEGIRGLDALLLGRRTYDIFAGYWPHHQDGPAGEIGRKFSAVPKYVASRGAPDLSWEGSTRIGADLVREVREIRDLHQDVHVIGSIDLVQTLLAHDLYDVLTLWVYPVVLGQGRKVFPDGAAPATMRLLEPAATGEGGAVQLRYGPTGAPPATGVMGD